MLYTRVDSTHETSIRKQIGHLRISYKEGEATNTQSSWVFAVKDLGFEFSTPISKKPVGSRAAAIYLKAILETASAKMQERGIVGGWAEVTIAGKAFTKNPSLRTVQEALLDAFRAAWPKSENLEGD